MTKCAWIDIDTGKRCNNKAILKGEPSYCKYHQNKFLSEEEVHEFENTCPIHHTYNIDGFCEQCLLENDN